MPSGFCYTTKKQETVSVSCFLVETVGIEPMPSTMSTERSNQLSYASICRLGYYTISAEKKQYLFHYFLTFFRFSSKKVLRSVEHSLAITPPTTSGFVQRG